jgi:hypothetical protein
MRLGSVNPTTPFLQFNGNRNWLDLVRLPPRPPHQPGSCSQTQDSHQDEINHAINLSIKSPAQRPVKIHNPAKR